MRFRPAAHAARGAAFPLAWPVTAAARFTLDDAFARVAAACFHPRIVARYVGPLAESPDRARLRSAGGRMKVLGA